MLYLKEINDKDIVIKNQYGKYWLKIFYQNSVTCDWFTSDEEFLSTNTEYKYSILGLIDENFKIGEYYEFLLQYPFEELSSGYNNWKQKIFPIDIIQENNSVDVNNGYFVDTSCHISWTNGNWKGLARSNRPGDAFVDGSYDWRWWFTIGAKKPYEENSGSVPCSCCTSYRCMGWGKR